MIRDGRNLKIIKPHSLLLGMKETAPEMPENILMIFFPLPDIFSPDRSS
jgi:hypothetical protein